MKINKSIRNHRVQKIMYFHNKQVCYFASMVILEDFFSSYLKLRAHERIDRIALIMFSCPDMH